MWLAPMPIMDEALSLDLNGKPSRACGWSDRLAADEQSHLGNVRFIPQPVNLFMNVGMFPDGRVETDDDPSKPGDSVVFKAWIDSIVALSACPQADEAA